VAGASAALLAVEAEGDCGQVVDPSLLSAYDTKGKTLAEHTIHLHCGQVLLAICLHS
jgi:hypothetical protein